MTNCLLFSPCRFNSIQFNSTTKALLRANLSLLSIYLSIYLAIYLSICLSIYLSVYISVRPSVCPSVALMPGGSTFKKCPHCEGILPCAKKICTYCLTEQPTKPRLKMMLERFDEKREEWVSSRKKKKRHMSQIKDEMVVMVCRQLRLP